jgi:hypothetical protein
VASTYSNLKIQLMATGENSGTWGNVTNTNLGTAIEQALVETATVTFASANVTLTLTDSNSAQNARALRLNLTGTTAGARDLIVPAIQKPYLINNGTADTITVKVSGQTGVAVPASTSMLLYNNGTDVIVAFNRVVANVVGNVTGNLTGTASNATVLQTARTIAISGGVTGTATSFNGSANITINATAINVDTATAGTLAVGRGGTGATTLNSEAVVIGNSTGAVKFVDPGTSGNVLTSNGTAWLSQAAAAGGGDYIMRTFTSPTTWTKPANLKAVKVTLVGGGGGGATVNPGPGQSGGAGGTSSFGAFLSATGGAGATVPANGAAGSGSGGDINVSGGPGNMVLGLYRPSGAFFNVAGVRQDALAQYIGTPIGGGGGLPDGTTQRNGGGGGGSIEYIPAPSIPGPVTVTVGAGGIVTGPAPVQPSRNAAAGAAGIVVVEEFY